MRIASPWDGTRDKCLADWQREPGMTKGPLSGPVECEWMRDMRPCGPERSGLRSRAVPEGGVKDLSSRQFLEWAWVQPRGNR